MYLGTILTNPSQSLPVRNILKDLVQDRVQTHFLQFFSTSFIFNCLPYMLG